MWESRGYEVGELCLTRWGVGVLVRARIRAI